MTAINFMPPPEKPPLNVAGAEGLKFKMRTCTEMRICTELSWELFSPTLPYGFAPLGVIDWGYFDRGALCRNVNTREYVQISAGVVRRLPKSQVVAALRAADIQVDD
jgi:hypothetical protein